MWESRGKDRHRRTPASEKEAGRVIDASGKYVMPGVIDVHVHPVYEDDMGGLSFARLPLEGQPRSSISPMPNLE